MTDYVENLVRNIENGSVLRLTKHQATRLAAELRRHDRALELIERYQVIVERVAVMEMKNAARKAREGF